MVMYNHSTKSEWRNTYELRYGRDLYDYDLSELIFNKPDYEKEYFSDKYLVTGHVPTMGEILEKNRHIAIDCGAGFGGKLGCICLETMEKYYV